MADIQDTIAGGLFRRNLHRGDHVAAGLLMGFHHLLQTRLFSGDYIVGQENCEGLIADQTAGTPDGMAQTKGSVLPQIGDGPGIHVGFLEDFKEFLFARLTQGVLQLGRVIEVILERGFTFGGNEDEFLDAGRTRFINGVLDERAVDEGHDFLRNRLGRRQEPRAHACDRKHRLGNFFRLHIRYLCNVFFQSMEFTIWKMAVKIKSKIGPRHLFLSNASQP